MLCNIQLWLLGISLCVEFVLQSKNITYLETISKIYLALHKTLISFQVKYPCQINNVVLKKKHREIRAFCKISSQIAVNVWKIFFKGRPISVYKNSYHTFFSIQNSYFYHIFHTTISSLLTEIGWKAILSSEDIFDRRIPLAELTNWALKLS